MNKKYQWKRWFIYALRHGLGGSLAIFTANLFGLQFATQAGVICIFSMLSTSKDTIKLTGCRLISFVITAVVAYIFFTHMWSDYVAFGIFIFITIIVSEMMGWGAALSANVVAGTHFLNVDPFTPAVIVNEFYIVLIGITYALVFNMIHDTGSQRQELEEGVTIIQGKIEDVLLGLSAYLKTRDNDVWNTFPKLQQEVNYYVQRALEYEGNTFEQGSHYYTGYFEMLQNQLQILHNLHSPMRKIQSIPGQAEQINKLIDYLSKHETELSVPDTEVQEIQEAMNALEKDELPKTREEFESRALLYHVITGLEDFLMIKWNYLVFNKDK